MPMNELRPVLFLELDPEGRISALFGHHPALLPEGGGQREGRTLSEAFSPGVAEALLPAVAAAAARGSVLSPLFSCGESPERFWFQASLFRLGDGDAQAPAPLACTLFDLTEVLEQKSALQLNQEIFDLFLQYSPIYTFFKDDRIRALKLSENYAQLLGRPLEQLLGRTMDELFPSPLAQSMVEDDLRVLQQGEVVEAEEEFNGRWFRTIKFPIVRAGKPRFLAGFTLDITESKGAADALQQSERHFRLLFENMIEGVALHQLIRQGEGPQDYRIVAVNPAFERITGLDGESIVGQLASLAYGTDPAPYLREYAAVVEEQVPHHFETHFPPMRKDFAISVVPWEGDGFATIFTDISERKNNEAALREREQWLLESQRIGRIGSYLLDVVSGIWTSSRALEELFGIDNTYPKNVAGWLALVHPEDRERMDQLLVQILAQKQSFDAEYRIVRVRDKAVRWMHGLGDLVLTADGQPLRMTGIIQDVTEKKQRDEEARRLEAQLLHAQKLESLGVLAGGIAHDFNNILMSVLGNADLALRGLSPASPAIENLRQIEIGARRAADLARQMLAYSGKGRFVIENLQLNAIVEEMLHMLQVSISKKVVVRIQLSPNLPPCEVDVTQVRQVLLNLVVNASEAIGERSGVVAISTGAMYCDRAYLSETWIDDQLPEGLYVFTEVADTGCGIERGLISKIFDPFFSTKFTGRGLGMAAVLGIVRGHKGAIKVYSEKGKGSNFKVLFPASRRAADLLVAPLPASLLEHGSGLILFADDEETVRALGKEMLEALGFSVVLAADGREALEVFRRDREAIACVILDLTMPHLDGEETFRELRRIEPAVRVLMSSGYNEQDVTQKFIGKGLAGFIQKPYSVAELGRKVKEVLAGG